MPVAPSTDASASTSPVVTSTTAAMPPFALRRRHLVDERLLGLPLQRFVERQDEVGTAAGFDLVGGGVGNVEALLIALDDELAVLARQQLVVEILEPVAAFAAGTLTADVTDQRAGERVGGIPARRLGHESDAGQLELLHGGNDAVAHSPSDVHEVEVRVGESREKGLPVDVQDRRELGRVGDVVGDVLRIGVDRRQLDRHREVTAVAIEDRAALRRQRHRLLGLVERHLPVAIAAQHLELRDAERQRAEHDHDQQAAHRESPRRVGRLPASPGARLVRTGREAAARRGALTGRRARAP